MTEALHKAAQAVLDRWDSPQWEWRQHGSTADLMAALRAALAQPPATTAQPVQQPGAEIVGWQNRWTNPGSDPMVHQQDIDWKPVASRAPAQTIQQRIDELRSHKYTDGKPCYEVRAIYTQAAPAQRQPLSDMQIFAATHAEMDSLLDHICDEGTASIGVKRRLCHFAHVIQRECAAAWGVTLAASPNTGEEM